MSENKSEKMRAVHGRSRSLVFLPCLILVIPWPALFLPPLVNNVFTLLTEFTAELYALIVICAWKRSSKCLRQTHNGRLLGVGVASLMLADLLFTYAFGRKVNPLQPIIGETGYTIFFIALAMLIKQQKRPRISFPGGICLLLAALSVFLLHYFFILSALSHPATYFLWFDRGHDYFYSLVASGLLVCMFEQTFRVKSLPYVSLLLALMLCMISDFSMRFHEATFRLASLSKATAGWTTGVVGMMLCLNATHRARLPLWPSEVSFISLRSLRCLACLASFSGMLVVLSGSYVGGLLSIHDANQLTVVLFLVWLCWAVTVIASSLLTERFERACEVIETVKNLEQASEKSDRLDLPLVVVKVGVTEIDFLLSRYNALADRASHMAAEMVRKRRDIQAGELASQLAHDIQSPLSALSGLMQRLGPLEPSTRLLVGRVLTRIRDIATGVLSIYDSDRAAADSLQYACLHSLVREVVAEVELQYQNCPHIAWRIYFSPEALQGVILGKVPEIHRALSNLLVNAVQAMNSMGRVDLVGEATATHLSLYVRDTGPGFCQAALARLGQRGSTFGRQHGLGFGLSQAHQALNALGGQLEVSNNPEGGAIVKLSFPRA